MRSELYEKSCSRDWLMIQAGWWLLQMCTFNGGLFWLIFKNFSLKPWMRTYLKDRVWQILFLFTKPIIGCYYLYQLSNQYQIEFFVWSRRGRLKTALDLHWSQHRAELINCTWSLFKVSCVKFNLYNCIVVLLYVHTPFYIFNM